MWQPSPSRPLLYHQTIWARGNEANQHRCGFHVAIAYKDWRSSCSLTLCPSKAQHGVVFLYSSAAWCCVGASTPVKKAAARVLLLLEVQQQLLVGPSNQER
jgi:hypothetical protein